MMLGKTCIGSIGYALRGSTVQEEFTRSWGQLIQYNAEHVAKPGQYIEQVHSFVREASAARNELVAKMRGDWLFQVDTDHQFEPMVLERLLHRANQYGADVVTGLYHERKPPFRPVAFIERGPGQFFQIGDWPQEPFYIGAAGAGCLLVRKSVFQRIAKELNEEPFDQRGKLYEDLSFFMRCRELGIPVLLDPRIQIAHLGTHVVTSADFDKSRAILMDPTV